MARTHVFTLVGNSAVAATAHLQRECLDSKDGYSSARVLQLHTQPLLVNILQQHTQTAYLGEVEVCVRVRAHVRVCISVCVCACVCM